MERLTDKNWRNLDPWECCGQDNYCQRDCHESGGCTSGCLVPKIYRRLAELEDLAEAENTEYIKRDAVIDLLHYNYDEACSAIVADVEAIPTADVAPVRPELRRVVKLLEKNYELGLNSEFVRDPLAWALYQTWKEIDGGAK